MNKRILFSILGLIVLLMTSITVSAQNTPEFESAPCPVDMPPSFTEGDGILGIECGFVTVPESRAEPDGTQIQLAVAIIHSASPNPAADPVFMTQGGPGGSTLDVFLPIAPLFLPILNQRDIILVEQRGTLYSEPFLTCPELTNVTLEYLADGFESDDYAADETAAIETCFQRLTDEGVNLSAYNSVENAADMISVADALNYDQINFYGISYGTLLGQHVLRDHEDRIRSIIFDAAVPTELNFIPDVANTAQNGFNTLFAACAEDALCSEQYPDLENTLYDTVAELNANPITITTIDPTTGDAYPTRLDGSLYLGILRQLLYITEFIPVMPYYIQTASEGDFGWTERLAGPLFIESGQDLANAMQTSVLCAEDADYTSDDIVTNNVRPELVTAFTIFPETIPAYCEIGNITALDDYVDEPVVSDVPALVTSGEFDPITPDSYGDILAASLPNSTHFVFPSVGHGALLGGQCPVTIMAAFIADPTADLNSSCIDDMGVSFLEFAPDPTGRLQIPVPQGFTDASPDDFARYTNDDGIAISAIAIDSTEADSVDDAIDIALQTIIDADFDRPAIQEDTFGDSLLTLTQKIYQNGATFIFAFGQQQGDTYIVVTAEITALQLNTITPIINPVIVHTVATE